MNAAAAASRTSRRSRNWMTSSISRTWLSCLFKAARSKLYGDSKRLLSSGSVSGDSAGVCSWLLYFGKINMGTTTTVFESDDVRKKAMHNIGVDK